MVLNGTITHIGNPTSAWANFTRVLPSGLRVLHWKIITRNVDGVNSTVESFIVMAVFLQTGWNNFTAWSVDVGHTLGEINASILRDGIGFRFIVLRYTNGTEYVFVYGYTVNKDVAVLSTDDVLFVYVTVEGYWTHTYE